MRAHRDVVISDADLASLVAYLRQIGREETTAPVRTLSSAGTGLTGRYFNNTTLAGTAALTRIEAIDFDWGSAAPGSGVAADRFSVRWSGNVEAPYTGAYTFQTVSDDGVRLRIDGSLLIDNWIAHSPATNTSATIQLVAGQRYSVNVEHYDNTGGAMMRLRWKPPGMTSHVPVPKTQLHPQ